MPLRTGEPAVFRAETHRTCTKCARTLPFAEFIRDTYRTCRRCRECRNEYDRLRRRPGYIKQDGTKAHPHGNSERDRFTRAFVRERLDGRNPMDLDVDELAAILRDADAAYRVEGN